MAWKCHWWVRWCSESAYFHGHMPSHMTWDDNAKDGGQPVAPYHCQGSQTQVWCHPIHWAFTCQWSQAQTPHHAGPNWIAKGLGQDIHWEDEGTIQLMAWVPLFVPGVYRRPPHNCCRLLTASSSIWKSGLVGSSPQLQHPTPQWFPAILRTQGLLGYLGNKGAVQNGLMGLIAWCIVLPGIFRGAWLTWCGSQRRMPWISHC